MPFLIIHNFKLFESKDISISNIIQVKYSFILSRWFHIILVTGVGGSLPCPHPPGYQYKIVLLVLFIFNYLNVKMYQF